MASGFLSDLDIRQVGWAKRRAVWMTLAPLRYRSEALGGRVVLVPAEFVTDLASVPRAPLAYLLAGGRGNRGAVVHDFPYQFGYWLLDDGSRLEVRDKKVPDDVFHESLLADPMSGVESGALAGTMWAFVRGFGRGVWADESRATRLNPEWSANGGPEA